MGVEGGAWYFREITTAQESDRSAIASIEVEATRGAIVLEETEVGGCSEAGAEAVAEGTREPRGGLITDLVRAGGGERSGGGGFG